MSHSTIGTDIYVVEADRHRNGVGGEGFYVGIVMVGREDGARKMITWFPEYAADGEDLVPLQTRIAVVDLDEAAVGNIYMHPTGEHRGNNAWRGADQYADAAFAIRDAVEARLDADLGLTREVTR